MPTWAVVDDAPPSISISRMKVECSLYALGAHAIFLCNVPRWGIGPNMCRPFFSWMPTAYQLFSQRCGPTMFLYAGCSGTPAYSLPNPYFRILGIYVGPSLGTMTMLHIPWAFEWPFHRATLARLWPITSIDFPSYVCTEHQPYSPPKVGFDSLSCGQQHYRLLYMPSAQDPAPRVGKVALQPLCLEASESHLHFAALWGHISSLLRSLNASGCGAHSSRSPPSLVVLR